MVYVDGVDFHVLQKVGWGWGKVDGSDSTASVPVVLGLISNSFLKNIVFLYIL